MLLPLIGALVGPVTGLSHYWVNDDVGHLLWVSGGFTGQPEYLNPVVGPIFGVIVSLLYRATTLVPWYPVAVLAIPTIACALFLRFLKSRVSPVVLFGFASVLTSGTLLLGLRLNYTFASFVSCAVGALWIVLLVLGSSTRFTSLIAPVIICILGLSLRTHWPVPVFVLPPAFTFAGLLSFVLVLMRYKRGETSKIMRFVTLMSFVYAVNWLPQVLIMQSNDDWSKFVDFYQARGALNGVQYVDDYLANASVQSVEAQTGIDAAGIIELRNWSLFDAESVSTESLRLLESSARQAQQQQGMSDQFTAMLSSAKQFLQVVGWFAFAAILGAVARIKTVGTRFGAMQFGVIGGLLLASTVMVVRATSGVRFPNYVFAGVVFTLALFLLGSQVSDVASGRFSQGWVRFVVTLWLPLVLVGCWHGLGRDTFVMLRDGNGLPSGAEYREQLRQSAEFPIPVIHNVMLVGYAYQSSPFDTSVPGEYLRSKNFGGGSNVRSPQYVRRWNYLTGENQTAQSLFNSAFYDRVMFENSYWYSLLFSYSKSCYEVVPNQQSFATRVGSPCQHVLVADAYFDDSSYWWSKPSGMNFDIVSHDEIDLELVLLAPFGEHAQPVITSIRVMDETQRHTYERIVVVNPGEGTKVELQDLTRGTNVVIRSMSPCMIPSEIDPIQYPDSRELCVGLGKAAINGIEVPLADIRG